MASKRGRPTTFPVAEVRKILPSYKELIIVNGTVVGKKNEVWSMISRQVSTLPGTAQVSASHLYVVIKENRYDLLIDILTPTSSTRSSPEKSLASSPEKVLESSSLSPSSSCLDSPTHQTDEDIAKSSMNFTIKLSRNDWHEIRPEHVFYYDKKAKNKQREVQRLRRKVWTHVINHHFWKHTKLPCKISYYGGRLSTADALHAITINGTCSACKATFYGYLNKIPDNEEEGVDFVCSYKGNFTKKHQTLLKRNLAGSARQQAVKKLRNEHVPPLLYHRSEADKLMELGDCEPAHLPSTSQLRVAKSKTIKDSRVDDNPIVALGKSMHESRCKNIIRDLSYDKFQIRYHSSAQIHVYRQYCKENEVVSIAIDATGGVVKEIKRAPGVRSGPIFMYSAVVRDHTSQKIYPICTLLSERHDTETIRHWLTGFLRCKVPPPHEVVVDMSTALMSACVQAFTSLPSLEAYINRCTQLLNLENATEMNNVPECFVRNDVAHVVKLITSWNCFQNTVHITINST